MDSTAGDLNHAAQTLDTEIEKKISHQSSHSALGDHALNDGKPLRKPESSSGSSTDDVVHMEKLDSRIVKIGDVKEGEEAWAHLPDHEKEIVKRQLDIPVVKVTFKTLYRYATRNDLIIVFISAICAIAGGAVMPLMTIIFGQLSGLFQNFFQGLTSEAYFNSELSRFTLYFLYLAIGEFVTIYICTVGFIYTGEHVTQKIREQYLAAILRQNIGFFDKLGAGEITTRITADTNLVQGWHIREDSSYSDSYLHVCHGLCHQLHKVLEANPHSIVYGLLHCRYHGSRFDVHHQIQQAIP